jgi:integrase/recombinase XerD
MEGTLKMSKFIFTDRRNKTGKFDLDAQIERFLHAKKLEKRSARTIRTYAQSLGQFRKWYFSIEDRPGINSTIVGEFIEYLTFEKIRWDDHPTNTSDIVGLSARSVNNLLRNLRVFFNYLVAERIIRNNPAEFVGYQKEAKDTFEVFADDDVVKLLSGPNRRTYTGLRDYCMMLVLCDTGVRVGELTALRTSDINFGLRQIVIRAEHAKTSETRIVPISQKTAKELERLISAMNVVEDDDFLWLSQFGERYFGDSFAKMLKLYAKRAGVSGVRVSPHTFRHYFAVKFLREGGDPFTLSRILGHSSLDMTQVYLKFTETDLRTQHDKASPVTSLIDKGNEKKRGKRRFT